MASKKCPNCDKKQLRRRGARLRRNVKRREKGNIHDPWVCDSCDKTFTDEEVLEYELNDDGNKYNEATGW